MHKKQVAVTPVIEVVAEESTESALAAVVVVIAVVVVVAVAAVGRHAFAINNRKQKKSRSFLQIQSPTTVMGRIIDSIFVFCFSVLSGPRILPGICVLYPKGSRSCKGAHLRQTHPCPCTRTSTRQKTGQW
jgi:hypothetical protein